MACCFAPSDPQLRQVHTINKQIERKIREDVRQEAKMTKLLLLGAGESGKSTLLKQMRLLHGEGFSEGERRAAVFLVHRNIMDSASVLLRMTHMLNTPIAPELLPESQDFLAHHDAQQLTHAPLDLMARLWRDDGIQAAYKRRIEFQLNDSTEYFFSSLDRIAAPDYLPSDQDILRSRYQTTGIVEHKFVINNHELMLIDVGGQRSQRRKWIHCFDDVTAVLFVSAVSEFNQRLVEDDVTNRLVESLHIFDIVVSERWFRDSSIILFLNKLDLLKKKIKEGGAANSVANYFPEYKGKADDVDAICQFFSRMFLRKAEAKNRIVFIHLTCATDTQMVNLIFQDVLSTVLVQRLKEFNML